MWKKSPKLGYLYEGGNTQKKPPPEGSGDRVS
jgi:hypothetical protein